MYVTNMLNTRKIEFNLKISKIKSKIQNSEISKILIILAYKLA